LLSLATGTAAHSPHAHGLEPEEILVVYRATSRDARPLWDHYRAVRGVPKDNKLGLHVTDSETVSRREFERWVLAPLRVELAKPERAGIRCLLLLRGLPIRVAAPRPGEGEPGPRAGEAKPQVAGARTETAVAAFDSELALVLRPPPQLEGWVRNPLYRPGPPTRGRPAASGPRRALMVARLDGPTLDVALGLIDSAIDGEKYGLSGEFCFDARGLEGTKGYAGFDGRIRLAAEFASRAGVPVKLDTNKALFSDGACPDTSLYIGWYALGSYRDAFGFSPGAIGYHVASMEAHSLRRGNAWVKGLLEDGIAATLGPVDEPYLGSFPDPVGFVARVLDGRYTLAEIYWETTPTASWMQLLIGDPLYRPRLARKRIRAAGGRPAPDEDRERGR
jgi:uncharacterized protein (TIGR03790 family)